MHALTRARPIAPTARRAPAAAPGALARPVRGASTATRAGIKVYTNPGSRGKIAEWVLAELGVAHEVVLLDMRKGEHKQPAYLAINPFGKVPAMTDGEWCRTWHGDSASGPG